MAGVTIYVTSRCGYCVRAKALLDRKGIPYTQINLDGDLAGRRALVQRSGGLRTVPQIWIGEVHVGGSDELHFLERRGRLDPLLADQGVTPRA